MFVCMASSVSSGNGLMISFEVEKLDSVLTGLALGDDRYDDGPVSRHCCRVRNFRDGCDGVFLNGDDGEVYDS